MRLFGNPEQLIFPSKGRIKMSMKPFEIGVTSWSFKIPEVKFDEILKTIKEDAGLRIVQVGAFGKVELNKEVQEKWLEALQSSGLEVIATCVAFNDEDYSDFESTIATVGFYDPKYFDARFKHLCNMAELTSALGVHLLTTHMGYIPHDTSQPGYSHILDATRKIADVLGEKQINLGMEVGGLETAEDLLRFVEKVGRENVKINFDPANLVRTAIDDPVETLDVLKEHVVLVHFKDAVPPAEQGLLGDIVALGQGAIHVEKFIQKLKMIGYSGPLIIEGEGGYDTVEHVCRARDLLQSLL
jgi:L-ribulose-5-phosphate 3-epimerase